MGSDMRIPKIDERLLGKSLKRMEGWGGNGGGNDSGCGLVPSGDRKGIDRQGIGYGSG